MLNKNIGIIGCGKRFNTIYFEILNKLNSKLFLWNRTKQKLEKYKSFKTVSFVDNIDEFKNLDLDLIICTVPDQHRLSVIKKLLNVTSVPILVETPVLDSDLVNTSINNKNRIGVIEQWPFLPLEQFKQMIYGAGLISKPYWVFNDGRSYDYHGMAQLRAYTGFPIPKIIKGSMMNIEQPGHKSDSGKINATSDFWTHGHVHMSNNTLLSHSFCYNCKASNLKPIQMIKCYSADGSIVTGRIDKLNDDYELAEIRYINSEKEVVVNKVIADRDDEITNKITAGDLVWVNKYAKLKFNDQQVAISRVIELAIEGKLYTPQNSHIDSIMINAMKESGMSHQTLSISN